MERICCIIDLDGFAALDSDPEHSFCKDYLVRELAYIRVSRDRYFKPYSYRFDLSFCDVTAFPEALKQTVHYQTRKITGLSFYPVTGERVHDYRCLPGILRFLYQRCCEAEMNVVAYKGGHRERDLLQLLGIPSIDLSEFGCPRFNQLMLNERPLLNRPADDCGYHRSQAVNVKFHCPLVEVVAFRDWLIQRL